jgi:hypothetical protein
MTDPGRKFRPNLAEMKAGIGFLGAGFMGQNVSEWRQTACKQSFFTASVN